MSRIKELIKENNFTQKGFSSYFGIPIRTVEDWCTEKRNPPDYVVRMIEEIIRLNGGTRMNSKKYAVVDIKDGSVYGDDKHFDTLKAAMSEAEYEWTHLTDSEKKKREAFYVMYGEPDEFGSLFEGDIVWDAKATE